MPRIVRFHESGDADVLRIEEMPNAEPGPGEIRISVEAFGLNRAEVLFRQGLYLEPPTFPSRIGYEAAGTVDAVGPGVEGFDIGERVSTIPSFSMGEYGVYGESAVVPAHAVARYPQTLTPVEGTAIWMPFMTAYGALVEYGRLSPADTVLITAASSSVGLAAIQIARSAGAAVIAATRGAGKRQALLDAGAHHVIVTDEHDLVEKVMEITKGEGARIIFDPVSGPLLEKLGQAAARGAVIFQYGALSMAPAIYPIVDAIRKGLSVRGYLLFEIVSDADRLARGKQFIYDGLASGALKPVIAGTFPLEDIADAHRFMESNGQIGKIVVTV